MRYLLALATFVGVLFIWFPIFFVSNLVTTILEIDQVIANIISVGASVLIAGLMAKRVIKGLK